MSSGEELHQYLHFAGRQRRDTALHVLEGFLAGVTMDHVINLKEHRELRDWIHSHERLAERDLVFAELLRTLKVAIADGILQPEEISDLRALCARAKSDSGYYDWATHAVQELHGILHGVVADITINEKELRGLQDWLGDYEDLRAVWPITEIESVVTKVLADGRIEDAEHRMMLHYFSEFAGNPAIKRALPAMLPTDLTVEGVCAVAPQIEFAGRVFCFTGVSSRGPRKLFAETVAQRNGIFVDVIRNDLDFLVIGDEGNPCWAFSCYGRKVERAVEMRRTGHRLLMIHESDFWDAVVT
jgi:hypothetical protein